MLFKRYLWINAAILILAFLLIGLHIQTGYETIAVKNNNCLWGRNALLICTVIFVQIIKGIRLYIELYEKHMQKGLFIRQYCKVVPVSMILPGKLGDFFRAYCFGYHIRDYIAGCSVIVLDRFVDTLGLLTVMLIFSLMYNVVAPKLFVLLVLSLLLLYAIYVSFPGMRRYWSHYLLIQPSSSKNIKRLSLLKRLQRAYIELQQVIHGKFLIVYLLSLLAWGIEIGSLAVYCKWLTGESVRQVTESYLGSAISTQPSSYLFEFIVTSVMALFFMYVVVTAWHYGRKRGCHE